MARSANVVVHAMTAVAATLLMIMVGADPVRLALVALVLVPAAVEITTARVPTLLGVGWNLTLIGLLEAAHAPKMVLLLAVTTATWVALRSALVPLNAVVFAVGVGMTVAQYWMGSPDAEGDHFTDGFLVWVAALLYGTGTGFILRRTRELAEELTEAQSRLVAAAAADERRRIAQDVHDLVAHSLAVALLNITGARRTMRRAPALADEALARAEEVSRESLAGIRRVVGLLREDAGPMRSGPGPGPLPAAQDIGDLVAGYRRSGLPVRLEVEGDVGTLDQAAGSVLFRTVREALANVLHHADAAPTWVRLDIGPRVVGVTVRNDLPAGGVRQRHLGASGVLGASGGTGASGGLGGTLEGSSESRADASVQGAGGWA